MLISEKGAIIFPESDFFSWGLQNAFKDRWAGVYSTSSANACLYSYRIALKNVRNVKIIATFINTTAVLCKLSIDRSVSEKTKRITGLRIKDQFFYFYFLTFFTIYAWMEFPATNSLAFVWSISERMKGKNNPWVIHKFNERYMGLAQLITVRTSRILLQFRPHAVYYSSYSR